jgi:hypothetical protein
MKLLKYAFICFLLMPSLYASRLSSEIKQDQEQRRSGHSRSGSISMSESQKKTKDKRRLSLPLDKYLTPTQEYKSTAIREENPDLSHALSNLKISSEKIERRKKSTASSYQLTFWEVYSAIKHKSSDFAPWEKIEGPLLERILLTGEQWKTITLDREPTPNITLFQVLKKFARDDEDNDMKRVNMRHVRVDYSLPLPYGRYTGEELLTLHFSIPYTQNNRLEHKESPLSMMKRLLEWQQGEDGKSLEKIQRMMPLTLTPLTPHDFSQRMFENLKPDEFIRLQYNRKERRLSIIAHQFRPGELRTLLPYFPKDIAILELENTNMRKTDATDLAPFLSDSMEKLNLSNNKLSDMAFMSLVSYFNHGLKILDLSGNRLGDVTLVFLAKNSLETLEELILGHNPITSKGLCTLALNMPAQLKKLDLSHTLIDDDGIEALARTHHLPHELNITHTSVGDRGVGALMQFGSKNLTVLHLYETKTGTEGRAYLNENNFTEALPNFLQGIWIKQ